MVNNMYGNHAPMSSCRNPTDHANITATKIH